MDNDNLQKEEVLREIYNELSQRVFNYIITNQHNFDALIDELKHGIEELASSLDGRLPGGKKISQLDKEILLGKVVIEGLKILSQARLGYRKGGKRE